jgi:hypothetical protein
MDYAALDRALAQRLEAENPVAQQQGDGGDEELRRALAFSMGQIPAPTGGNAGTSPQPQPAPQAQQPQAPAAHPAPRRRSARRNLPLNSRVAAICMLSERVDPTTLADDENNCSICAAIFGETNDHSELERPVRLPGCQHLFGNACIHRWLRRNTNCPQCRREYIDELNDRSIDPASQDEEFAWAYEEGIRRESVIEAEEAGRPPPEEDNPFFAEPSLQELQMEEENNRRFMREFGGGSGESPVRRPSRAPVRRPASPPASPPGARPRSLIRRRPTPPRTGFGMGRPGRPLSPQPSLYGSPPALPRGYGGPASGSPPRFGSDYGFTWGNRLSGFSLGGVVFGSASSFSSSEDAYRRGQSPPRYSGGSSYSSPPQQGYRPPPQRSRSYTGPPPQQYPFQPAPTIQTPHGSRPLTTEEMEELGIRGRRRR